MPYSIVLTRGDPIGIKLINDIVVNDGTQDLTLTKTGSLTSLGFDVAHLTYDIGEIENTVTSFTITADLDTTSVGASVEVTGADTLGLGTNTIEVVARAQDDSTITYAITYFRNAAATLSKDSSMTALRVIRSIDAGRMIGNPNPSFYPPFSPDITEYFLRSPDGTGQFGVITSSTFTITPTLAAGASLPADFLAMRVVTTDMVEVFTMLVTAEDGLRQTTYTLNINLKQGLFRTNADLSALTLSAGTLSFDAATTSYDVNVTGTVDSLTVTATLADTAGNVAINGAPATSGTASPAITLAAGATTVIQVVVFAEDTSTMKTYTINVARAAQGASSDATLSALALSAGASLNESFAAATTVYTATVPFATPNLTVTPTASDSGAVITVQGATVASAAASDPIALAAGTDTVVTIAVLANDKVATQTYTLTITRTAAATDATLSALVVTGSDSNAVTLTKTGSATTANFAPTHFDYAASVLNTIASVTIMPTATDSKIDAITVQGVGVASGATSNAVPLTAGATTNIAVIVTAEDTGVMQTYTLAIARGAALSTDANLSDLEVDGHALNSAFASSDTTYSIGSINTNIATLSITATTTDNDATLTAMLGSTAITPAPTSATPFNVDISGIADGASTSITITVAPEDTSAATKAYVITFIKVTPSTDNTLSGLAVDGHAFANDFAAATTDYTLEPDVAANIGTLMITATRNDGSTLALAADLGEKTLTPPTSGTPFSVDISGIAFTTPSVINIVVTAQDGTERTYSITFTRAAPTAAPAQVGTITTADGSGVTIQISWAPLADASITSYQYRYRVNEPLGEWQPSGSGGEMLPVVAEAGARQAVVDAQGAVMTPGNCGRAANSCSVLVSVFAAAPYGFQARAVNAAGAGDWSALTAATNQGAGEAPMPGMPTALTITEGIGELGLSWSSGTGTVTDHRVRWREAVEDGAQENPWLGWIDDAPDLDNSPIIGAGGARGVDGDGISTRTANTSYTLTNLTANTTYEVQVAAVNEASLSGWSETASATPQDNNIEQMTANAQAVAKSVSAAVVLSGVLDAVSQNAFDATGSFTPFVDVTAQYETESRAAAPRAAAPRQALVPIAPLLLSEQPQQRDADWRELLGASSFRLGITAGEFGDAISGALGGGEWSVWGSGDVRGFNGGGDIETEGLGYSVYLGTDYKKGNWLAGIAAGYSSTTADITADGKKSQSEFWLAGGYPYLRYSWQNQIDAWLLLGAGGGQLMLKDEDASAFVVSHLYAAGAKANVLRAGRLSLAAKADVAANFALSVSTTDNLNDFDTMQQRVRVGVDAAYDYRGTTHGLRPHLEVGARIDFGAGESDIIAGAEVAGGVRYEYQPLRLSVDARGRALVYDTTGLLREWGAGATIRLVPAANGTGLAASLTPGWGVPQSRTDNMWQDNTPTLTQSQSPTQALSLRGELAYTFKHKDARITPLTQYSLTTQSQTIALGTRLNLTPLSLELLGERIDHTTTPDDYRLRLNTSLRF